MKKLLSLLLCLILCLSLFACNSEAEQTTKKTKDTKQTTQVTGATLNGAEEPKNEEEALLSKYKITVRSYCDCIHDYKDLSFSVYDYWDGGGDHAKMPQEMSVEFMENKYVCYLDKAQFSKPPIGEYKYFDDEGNAFFFDTECNLVGIDFKVFPNEASDRVLTLDELRDIASEHARRFIGDDISEYKLSYKFFEGAERYVFSFRKYLGEIMTSEYFSVEIDSNGCIYALDSNKLERFNEGGKFDLVDFDEIDKVIDIIKSRLSEYHKIPKEEIEVSDIMLSVWEYKETPTVSMDILAGNHSLYACIYVFYLQ